MHEIDCEGVKSIIGHFEVLPDPRDTRNRRHLLVDIIVISVCAVMACCEGPTAIERWAKAKKEFLEQFLALPNGIPSHDCIRRVLLALHPEAFQKCFESWVADRVVPKGESDESPSPGSRHVAIDGKSLRRSHDKKSEVGPLHLVSAWAAEEGISLGQVATEEKSNEITAIPELLEQINVNNTIVTIDAMGCQKKIAKQIVDGKGDFVLAVKENQPTLYRAIETRFDLDSKDGDQFDGPLRHFETHDKSHGRIEDRFYFLAKVPKAHPTFSKWPGLKAIGMAIRVCTKDGKTTEDRRYYIVSRYLTGQRFAETVRGHWAIENTLHWQLDVTFREDDCRIRHRRLTNNMAWLRRFAISLLKRHPSKDSIKGKAQTTGWNDRFLMEVLTSKQT